jgi:mannose-6-phosphate isomerase-like protein (cupin superfamily)
MTHAIRSLAGASEPPTVPFAPRRGEPAATTRNGPGLMQQPPREGRMGSVERAFHTQRLPTNRDGVAPDGSDVRILLKVRGGSLAHFELAAGQTSVAVRHRTVEEIWYFLSGTGEMWRRCGEHGEVVPVSAGVCITIPLGTSFQFRAAGGESLAAIGATIPPWPGSGEAIIVAGPWEPTVQPGPT